VVAVRLIGVGVGVEIEYRECIFEVDPVGWGSQQDQFTDDVFATGVGRDRR